jgi:cobalt-zinc-cadmium efflux system protein
MSGHGHHHGSAGGGTEISRKLIIATAANAIFVVVELGFGIAANSLALIGDALHNLTDSVALLIAFVAVILERRPPTPVRSFGYQRAGILAAFVNAGALMAFTIFIFSEAWERLQHPAEVNSSLMIIVASIGVLLNGGVSLWLREEGRTDVNIRAAVVHLLADALASVGVIVAGIMIRRTGQTFWDPAISAVIGVLIIWSAWGILRETVNLLLEGTPRGIDPDEVSRALAAEEGVYGVHHLHIWAIAPSRPALSCHLQLGDVSLSTAGEVLRRVSSMLARQYRIAHTTIQFEHAGCPDDDPYCLLPPNRKGAQEVRMEK